MISRDTSANVIQNQSRATLGDSRPAELAWLGAYLVAWGFVLAAAGDWRLATAHALLAGLILLVFQRPHSPLSSLVPLVVAPLLYGEVPVLIAALGSPYHDATVQAWEHGLFGTQLSQTAAGFLPSTVISELVHAGYLAYYLILFVPPLLLLVRGERRGFSQTVLDLTVTCAVCWTIFALWPVEGPRYLWGPPPDVPNGPVRRLTLFILASASSRGAAFPSSHMALSVVQAAMAWRWQRRLAPPLTVLALLVGVGAVYGGFHYATDIAAGALLGSVISLLVLRTTHRPPSGQVDAVRAPVHY
jgi:membrane-associated phospholipid phosphatase